MKIIQVESDEFKKTIISCIESSGLIPIIGSGFTKGCKSHNGNVPDGDQLKEIMIKTIKSEGKIPAEKISKIMNLKLKEVSRYYLKEKYVSKEQRKSDIINYFTRVELDPEKRKFINLDWKFIYTLNIDDAIERANKNLNKILPYKKIEKRPENINLVYKVHGCAIEETTYTSEDTLIFSEHQYIRSLTKNEHILNDLKCDIRENNLIYIGCSLDREIDLIHAISGEAEDESVNATRIYITKNTPDEIEIDRLEEDYGINIIATCKEHGNIYRKIIDAYNEKKVDNKISEYSSKKITEINNEKNKNIEFMLQGESCIRDMNNKEYYLPNYTITRSIEEEISKKIISNDTTITVIKGRRFSGKTTALKSMARKVKDRECFFIPSTKSINKDEIEIILNKKNSVIFFDSNTITYIEAYHIRNNISKIEENKTKIVICCNPTEIDISNTFQSIDVKSHYIDLNNRLNENETESINYNLDKLGIIKWKKHINILENTRITHENYPHIGQKISTRENLNETDIKIIILLALLDKVYISLTSIFDYGNIDVQNLQNKLGPIIDIVPTTAREQHQKSKFKIVANSKKWILDTISEHAREIGKDATSEIIIKIVKSLINNKKYEEIAKKLIMFDTVNQFFSRKEGAGRMLTTLYENLQPILGHDPDYWLQRSKAMSKILKKYDDLLHALDYAKKAYEDSNREKTTINAEFTIANIYGKLCRINSYKNHKDIEEALKWYSSSIRNHSHNKSYIDSMLETTSMRKSQLYLLCEKIISMDIKLNNESKRDFNEIYKFINVRSKNMSFTPSNAV